MADALLTGRRPFGSASPAKHRVGLVLELRTTVHDIPFNGSLQTIIHAGSRFPADSPPPLGINHGIAILEAGYLIRESEFWSFLAATFERKSSGKLECVSVDAYGYTFRRFQSSGLLLWEA